MKRSHCCPIAVLLSLGLVAFTGASAQANAQEPVAHRAISIGEAIDTANESVGAIVRLTRAYLADPSYAAVGRGWWSGRTPLQRRLGDLTLDLRHYRAPSIVGVSGGAKDSTYVVKVLYTALDSVTQRVIPIALQRLLAIRNANSPFGWQLSSPLPHVTRNWKHRTYGRLTFWYAPGQREQPIKAKRAAAFVDSVARAFRIPPPRHLDVYLTGSADELHKLRGLDYWWVDSGPGAALGALTYVNERLLILGNPERGEENRNELVRAVLQPHLPSANMMFPEGTALWLGGAGEKSPRDMYAQLVRYQTKHPEFPMPGVFVEFMPGEKQLALDAMFATAGLIVRGIHKHSGLPGLLRFSKASLADGMFTKVLPELLGVDVADMNQWWRREALSASRP